MLIARVGRNCTLYSSIACRCLLVAALLATRGALGAEPEGNGRDKPILVLDPGGHTSVTRKLCFTRDGRELISVSDDKTIRFWDVRSGEPLRVLRPPIGPSDEGRLYAASLSPDGRRLAIGGCGLAQDKWGAIYLIALPSGQIERTLKGHIRSIQALAFSPDGRQLASASTDQTARLWNVATGECQNILRGHTAVILDVAYSPDGLQLATASYDHTARVWSAVSGQNTATLSGHQAELRAIAWSPDGRTIATGGHDQSVRLWSPDGKPREHFDKLGDLVRTLAFIADSTGLLVTFGGALPPYRRREACILEATSGRVRVRFAGHTNTVYHGAFSPDGTLAATAGGNNHEIFIWKTADATALRRLAGSGRGVFSCGWSPDGQVIAWGNSNRLTGTNPKLAPLERAFRLADLDWAELNETAAYRRAQVVSGPLALETDGEYVVTVKRGAETVSTIKLKGPEGGLLRSYTFVPGEQVAVGASYGFCLFDARTGKRLRKFHEHTGHVWGVAPSPDGRYLLSASWDQILRICDPKREDPLLSLFFAGDEWVIWTPEGYYAASPGGEQLMGWHVNNGPAQMGSFYPAGQFRKSLYRPDVIRLVLQAGSTEAALKLADQARGHVSQPTRVEEVMPPRVVITTPDQPQVQVHQSRLTVRAQAKPVGADPITAVRLLCDGRPYQGRGGAKGLQLEGAVAKIVPEASDFDIDLTPGMHKITVKAETAKSYGISEPIEVSYAPEQQQLPALYVVSVGISAYKDEKLRLAYAAADARSLAEAFQKSAGPLYRTVDVKILADGEATRSHVLKGLHWLMSQMTQHDVGVFAFSGHGDKDSQGTFFLLPSDCQTDDLSATGVSMDELKRSFQAIPGRLLVLLDCCHAGAMGGDRPKGIGGLTDELVRDLVTDDYGVIMMCASMGREISWENDTWRHGAFTKAVVEGLQGAADYDRDGIIYLTELDHYVSERVKALTGGKQHAATQKPATIHSFPIAKPHG
jgi:WD40 repeat protein